MSDFPQQPPSPCIPCAISAVLTPLNLPNLALPLDWPDLQPQKVTFSGDHPVENDTDVGFVAPHWLRSRSQKDQTPVCYTRKSAVALTADFEVTHHPISTETVNIRGTATCSGIQLVWTANGITVSPAAPSVTIPVTVSGLALPDVVACYDPLTIAWEMTLRDGSWKSIGSTQHLLYATLNAPNGTPAYWTLLDVSCRAAQGQSTEADVVTHVFEPLRVPGLGVTRKRDGRALTYWNPQTTTATNTQQLLQSVDGSGQCGSWAEFLLDMYKVHGILTGDKVLVQHADRAGGVGFLVKNWTFVHPPASSANNWSHVLGVQCITRPPAGIPGQGNPNPPPAFENHFIVRSRTTNQFYDPSYGAGPFADQNACESAAIAGLYKNMPATVTLAAKSVAGFDTNLAHGRLLQFYDLTTRFLIP